MSKTHVTHLTAATVSFVFGIAISVLGTQMIAPIEFVPAAHASVVPAATVEHTSYRYFDRSVLEDGSLGYMTYSHIALGR